jgi:hypothetical protein
MNRTHSLSILAATLTLAGCYSPGGGLYPASGNGYTYISSEMRPVTITLFDTRTEEPFFKLEIPAGKQLTLNFLEGKGDDPVLRPDRMVYSVWATGTSTGRLTNQLAKNRQSSRTASMRSPESPPGGPRRADRFRLRRSFTTDASRRASMEFNRPTENAAG